VFKRNDGSETVLSLSTAGPLALVEDGDIISIDVLSQSIDLKVSHEEMQWRSAAWAPPSLPLTQVRWFATALLYLCACIELWSDHYGITESEAVRADRAALCSESTRNTSRPRTTAR